ncbi:hypothetical protein D3C85_1877890 [compost metagenome]
MTAMTGMDRGSTICARIRNSPAPSIRADSIRLSGSASMEVRMMIRFQVLMATGMVKAR